MTKGLKRVLIALSFLKLFPVAYRSDQRAIQPEPETKKGLQLLASL